MDAVQTGQNTPEETEHNRRLLILRHAKSSWADPKLRDFDRPLNARGKAACKQLGKYLRKAAIVPDITLCSAAKRTTETYKRIADVTGWQSPVHFNDSLYAVDAHSLLQQLQSLSGDISLALLIGHNPAVQDLVLRLSGSGRANLLEQVENKFPTGTLADITFKIGTWQDLETGCGLLRTLILARSLPA